MHKAQIYLQESLYLQLQAKAKQTGLSISELICQAVQRDLTQQTKSAKHFFATHAPVQSFRDEEPTEYVERLRKNSRIFGLSDTIDE